MGEYRGDVDDPRYEGWSYLGDRYRCPLADDELRCHHRANRLMAGRREDELRQMVDEGHRCAFIRMMELLVAADRVDDLRALAMAGDERAGVTLAEYWVHRRDEAALRREIELLPRTAFWLATMLDAQERSEEAVQVLEALATNASAPERYREGARAMLRRRTRSP